MFPVSNVRYSDRDCITENSFDIFFTILRVYLKIVCHRMFLLLVPVAHAVAVVVPLMLVVGVVAVVIVVPSGRRGAITTTIVVEKLFDLET